MARKPANGADVRAWANSPEGAAVLAEKGLTIGLRGRLSADVQEAFRKATGRVYTKGHVHPVKVKGVRVTESGRKVPVTVNAVLSDVRATLAAEGVQVGARGRISAENLALFAARPR